MGSLGLGIIGLGQIGKVHLQHSLQLKNVKVVAACDKSRKALATAKNAGIEKIFTDYSDLLKDRDVEAVVIALPTFLHKDCAKQAAEMKKHILLEKPMAINVSESEDILSACQRNSVRLMVGYPLRFDSRFIDLKRKFNSGLLGDVEVAHAVNVSCGPFFARQESYQPTFVPDWWFDPKLTGGGALMDLGSHMIDLLRWYFGEMSDVRSSLGYRYHLDVEDSAICIMGFKSGTTAIVNVGWFSQTMSLKLELFGTVKAESSLDLKSNPLSTVVQNLISGTSKFFLPHLMELEHFVNCVLNDLQPQPSGIEGLKDVEAVSKAYLNKIAWNQIA